MKNTILTLIVTFALASTLSAGDSATPPTPNGGRLLKNIKPQAEFFVTPERKAQITFLDEKGKAIAPAEQIVTIICGERSDPTRLEFVRENDVLLSKGTFPKGNGFPTIVQIKTNPDAKPVLEKFNLNVTVCSGCQLAEYACTCGHLH